MPLSLKTIDREKVNIRPNEFVVSVVANRPHNRLIENDIQMTEYINAMTLQDLVDVGRSDATEHSFLEGGDTTQDGENTPNILVRLTDQDNFSSEPMDQVYLNILRPSVENGELRIGPGYWNSFTDLTKTVVVPVSMNTPLYYPADQGKVAPFWEYLAMEDNILSPVVYDTEIEAASSFGVYVAAIRTELVGGVNEIVEVLDRRPVLNPTSAAVINNIVGAFVDLEPWIETHYITQDVPAGAVIQTTDLCHTYHAGGSLVVFHNRGRLSRCDDYVELGNRSIRLRINLREGDKIIMQHLVGVQENTIEGLIGDYSPSYSSRVVDVDTAPGYIDDIGFPYESGLGWLQVFRNGKKLNPGVDYRENADDRTVTFLIDLITDDLIEYHYSMGFTRLFSAAGAPDIVSYDTKEVPFVGMNILDITSGFGFEDLPIHDLSATVEVSQVELDLSIVSSDGTYDGGGQINLFIDWDADIIVYNAFWKGFTSSIPPYTGAGDQQFTAGINNIEIPCGDVVLYASVDANARTLKFLGLKEHNTAASLDADQTLLLSNRIHNWSQRSNSRSDIEYINASGTYPVIDTDRNKIYVVSSADAIFVLPTNAKEGINYRFIKASSDASIKIITDVTDDLQGQAGGYLETNDTREPRSSIELVSTTLNGVGLGPTSWDIMASDGRWKLYNSANAVIREMHYGIDEESILSSTSAGNYKYDTRTALGNTNATDALAFADAALGGLPNGSEMVIIYLELGIVYSGRYIKQATLWIAY